MGRHLVAVLLGLAACGGQTGTRDRIRSSDEIADEYKSRVHDVYAKGFRELVWPKCEDPKKPPEAPCGYVADELLSDEGIARFRATSCKEGREDTISDTCVERFRGEFFSQLSARYPRAEPKAVREQCTSLAIDCNKLPLFELAVMAAHNAVVRARIRTESDALVEEHRAEQLKRGRQVEAIEHARAEEAAAWRAVAAGLAGAARGMNEAMPPSQATGSTPSVVVRECSSDFDCGMGNVCAKAHMQMHGVCAKAVDAYGVQTFPTPRDNFGPGGPGQCTFDTQCPVGFKCLTNGALSGNCVK
jgi:hypothetical protein